ncbi:MAG: hypothetical protein HC898_08285, partial [Phycisphaerales bacterium]|nr:hypothetical protein [Phycisphaerales bacterium]
MHIPELGNSWSTEKDPWGGGLWPAHWIRLPNAGHPPKLMAYRCTFDLPKAELIQVAVSADERYKLYLDGKLVSIGVQRCDPGHWPFRLLDWNLEAGKHTLVALVWALGHEQALAQVSVSGGRFILAARPPFAELLNTGRATWHGKLIRGYRFTGKGKPGALRVAMKLMERNTHGDLKRDLGMTGWQWRRISRDGADWIGWGMTPRKAGACHVTSDA